MKDFETFLEFVNKMLESNSRNHKLEVLKEYQTDESVRFFLNFLYNPYVTTGISFKKITKPVAYTPDNAFTTVQGLLTYISTNNTGKDEVLAKIHAFEDANELNEDAREVFYRVICKDLPLGVDVLSINKVMPGLVPTFNVMLANKYFDKPEIVEGKEFTITTKIDGGRIIALKKNGEVKFYTRAGQEYEGLFDIKKELEDLPFDNFALDGEITLLDKGTLTSKDQYKQTMMITRKDGEKHGVKILAFDYMPSELFTHQAKTREYKCRRTELEHLFSNLKYVTVLPALYSGSDTSMIMKLLNEQVARGEEGVMININDAPYDFKRTNSLLKVKKMQDLDLEIIGFEQGTNQNANKLGAFVVDYKGNPVRVGSGISKELREEVWRHREDYLGMTIIVQYFEETKNQAGGISLRFPVFVDFRTDK